MTWFFPPSYFYTFVYTFLLPSSFQVDWLWDDKLICNDAKMHSGRWNLEKNKLLWEKTYTAITDGNLAA